MKYFYYNPENDRILILDYKCKIYIGLHCYIYDNLECVESKVKYYYIGEL